MRAAEFPSILVGWARSGDTLGTITAKPAAQGIGYMAKPNYAFAKRQRDLEKKRKKEAKKLKKAGDGSNEPGEGEAEPAEGAEAIEVSPPTQE